MKTRQIIYAALAITALASCTSNDYVGDQTPQGSIGTNGAISFNYQIQNITRGESDHTTSAANLGNQFIVWGEKSDGASDTKDAPAPGHIVFPNYQVNYTSSTANTTTSNSKDWEYVGYTHSTNYQNYIKYKATSSDAIPGSSVAQTLKYWDYNAGSYTFTAVSASKLDGSSKTDIENGYVQIQKNIDDDNKASNKGYTITVTANADLSKLYFSDRAVITKSNGTDRTAVNAYGGNVTLKFRNVLSQIRAGIYETIPGYAISDIKFYVNTSGETPTQTQVAQVESTDAFGAICPNIKGTGYAGDLTVTYSEVAETLNQPIISAGGTPSNNLILGTNISTVTTSAPLGISAAAPTWDTAEGAYTAVMLQGAHTTNLTLKCDYTLYNSVSGETINVTGATVEVPYQYLQWKPNYKYSYLFKITDEKLYPITFDAIEVTNSDGMAEYITIVNDPSITTYAKASAVTTDNEYKTNANIYVVVGNGTSLTVDNAKLYTATNDTGEGTVQEITEASVANALTNGAATDTNTDSKNDTWTVTGAGMKPLIVTTIGVPTLTAITTIPAADSPTGADITINGAKFTPTAAGTYVFEYTDGSANKHYKVIKVVAAS